MKASIAVARQTQAAEQVAADVAGLKEQLDRVEVLLTALLDALAHDAQQQQKEVGDTPKRGRPAVARS